MSEYFYVFVLYNFYVSLNQFICFDCRMNSIEFTIFTITIHSKITLFSYESYFLSSSSSLSLSIFDFFHLHCHHSGKHMHLLSSCSQLFQLSSCMIFYLFPGKVFMSTSFIDLSFHMRTYFQITVSTWKIFFN